MPVETIRRRAAPSLNRKLFLTLLWSFSFKSVIHRFNFSIIINPNVIPPISTPNANEY